VSAGRYVALGSSMAAGPGIPPRVPGSPRLAARSARNYPHLVATDLGFDLVDVTYSGATTAHILTDSQHGAPPQIEALTPDTALVTITIGGNDIGYVPMLSAATMPALLRRLPPLRDLLGPAARDRAVAALADSMRAVGEAVRARCDGRVMFVDYLTLLPPGPAPPLSDAHADLGRRLAARLADVTAAAAADTGCELVRAAQASVEHHAWSADPWTLGPGFPLAFLFGRPAPLHPNAAGMRAVADLVIQRWRAR
jgi:lysophospholipase L1-like esterase